VLHRLATTGDEETRTTALQTLELDHRFRLARVESAARSGGRQARPVTFARVGGQPQRTIYDQQQHLLQSPGKVVRAEGQAPVADQAVNRAFDALGDT
jgi:hypothetical protein